MKDEQKKLAQRHRGTEGQARGNESRSMLSFRASVPLCEILFAGVCLATLLSGVVVAGDDAVPSPAPPVQQSAKAWPLGRGNGLADGVAKTTLPEKPEVVWKVTVEKGAFDGTPVIAEGVVYLG